MRSVVNPRVLVVDDEAAIRTFASRALRTGRYDVTVASDAADALRLIEHHAPFDLFVLDVVMPGLRGDELAAQIRRSDPDAKVLYVTGFSDQLFRQRASLWADEAFIEKPVTVNGALFQRRKAPYCWLW